MAVKVFLTGATGYIGGDILFHIHHQRSDVEWALLVRSEDKAKKISAQYPAVRIVLGDLDDSETLTREASWADVVIHTADSSDHVGAAEAIAKGLIEGHTKEHPGYWLHTGGTGILTYFDTVVKKTFGEPDDKVFNDYEGVSEVVNLPADAFHRNVDEIVLKTTREHPDTVKATIVCPPLIYGKGRGPISGRGRQVYVLADFILLEKYCPRIGRGLGRMNNVHIVDLSQVYELLLEAALDPVKKDDKQIWGAETYFFTENGEHEWATLARQIGEEAQKLGFIAGPPPEFREYSMEEAEKYAGFEAASWGMNSRCKAVRARKVLSWKPWERSLVDEIPTIIVSEAKRLELPLPV